jgi:hypothetical protein
VSRARIPRRVKWAGHYPRPVSARNWKLVRRYYLRLSAAVKRVEAAASFASVEAVGSLFARMRLVYRLEGHTPVWEPDVLTWAQWMETGERQVALDTVGTDRVSTVFLGCNYCWTDDAPPILFETMVFSAEGAALDQQRYSSWDEALAGHAEVVAQRKDEGGDR